MNKTQQIVTYKVVYNDYLLLHRFVGNSYVVSMYDMSNIHGDIILVQEIITGNLDLNAMVLICQKS